ncbi:protein beta [Pseudoalteromonas sp. S1688]|uniref:beta family protein n=1 Tax=Pseudoalteromonas sp. S1688 TaxID=579511 RepID=UPI00110BABED|nr:protein beta [Pseudoalteromonas sp. S1688]TMP49993.1 protein beta [Pseudoalteromonas sp. S1688]
MFTDFKYKYSPILSISPSELNALKELPNKDKDLILPIFPLKSWATTKELSKTIEKIESTIGKNNYWIADIDYLDLAKRDKAKYRQVHFELEELIDSSNGYKNWCDFIKEHDNCIPSVQLKDLSGFAYQLNTLASLQRGVVVIIKPFDIESKVTQNILPELVNIQDLFIVLDLEQITKAQVDAKEDIANYLRVIQQTLPNALLSVSSTSFPDGFGGYYRSVNTIYERALYNKLKIDFPDLIYSDRGSTRATKMSGGAGVPPPRIDYSCKDEWNFIRMEFSDDNASLPSELKKEEKKELYTLIAQKIMLEPYWESDLGLWANYIIELTSKGDDYGINNAMKATAVRINKHLHTQLHYDEILTVDDTDDDWVD